MVGMFVLTQYKSVPCIYYKDNVFHWINVEKLSKELLNLDVVKGLANVISVPSQSLDVVNMALRALSVLVEYGKLHKYSLL